MKKFSIILIFTVSAIVVISCSDVKRERGRNYMPDMATSRAYETYDEHSNRTAAGVGFNYNNQPVKGTVNRGEEMPYHLANDSTGYRLSGNVKSPIATMNGGESTEAERLYLINCAICHGSALDGNGPLYKGGAGPYPAKPATLVGDPNIEALSEGTIFHVQTYGKNLMGSYAAQLTRKQRWMIAQFIKSKQLATKTANSPAIPQGDTTQSKAIKGI